MEAIVNRLVSIEEGREKWLGGLSRTATYELINRGDVVKVNIGRRSFLTTDSLAAYVSRLSEAAVGGDEAVSASLYLERNHAQREDDARGGAA